MIWFTADTHWDHPAVIRHSGRPWDTVEEMNEALLSNINEVVGKKDTLYHLGDFAWKQSTVGQWRSRINCKDVRLVLGNHDPHNKNGTPKKMLEEFFTVVSSSLWVRIGEKRSLVVLSHYAYVTWHKMHFGSLHLHGHSHGSLEPHPRRMDVGVDGQGFYPISETDVLEILGGV